MSTKITGKDVQNMIRHWLKTPINGYLGSDYGQDAKALLQLPMGDSASVDAYLQKLRSDIALLLKLPVNAVNIYSVERGIDKKEIVIEVAGVTTVTLDGV